MPDVNESSSARGEKVKDGRIIINQVTGAIEIYDITGQLRVKQGDLGEDGNGDVLYGTEVYDEFGVMVTRTGFLGRDPNGNPVYGTGVYDENGLLQALLGKHTGGF